MTAIWFVLGLLLLIAGAECLVRGASKLATGFGIPPLVVGLTVVAFGTSAPELAVSVQSALAGRVDIATANVVGSNIFNVLFILGSCALIAPLVVADQIIRQEVPIMIGASILLLLLALDGGLSRIDGAMFFGLFVIYTVYLIVQARRAGKGVLAAEYGDELAREAVSSWDRHWSVQLALIASGLVLLVLGSNWLVDAAITIAKRMGVSDVVIGLTIVAAGTSMPEFATSILATIRGHRDIAVGNVVGSNTFNILGVLGVASIVAPTDLAVASSLRAFDIPVMLAVALAALPIFVTGRAIARWEGALFIVLYALYTTYLILAAQRHDALDRFGGVLASVVAPVVVVTLIVMLLRAPGAAQR